MARPLELEKRRDLARQAVEVLRREGMDLPTARLAEALGMKRPTLLYHFPTRAEIAMTALEELLTAQAAFVAERVGQREHPIDRLDAHMRAIVAFHEAHGAQVLFLTQALATAGAVMTQVVDLGVRLFDARRKRAVADLRAGMAAGTVAPCDPVALVNLVRAAMDGLVVHQVATRDDPAPVLDLLWERVLRPLKIDKELAL